MRALRPATARATAALACAAALLSCTDATDVDLLEVDASGVLFGVVFLDNNGNGTLDSQDGSMPGLDLRLTSGRGNLVKEATSDTAGAFLMRDIPVGTYRLSVAEESLGDSLTATSASSQSIGIALNDTTQFNFGVSFPVLDLDEVRASPAGRRVFTSGIALNTRVNFGDSRLHVQAGSSYLRAVEVERGAVNLGDSVRLLGRTSVDAGQPVLSEVTPVVLVQQATLPVPEEIGTGMAAQADGGRLDAALVRVRTADISDTASAGGDFRFAVDDGSGPVEVVFQAFLGIDPSIIVPDSVIRVDQVTGLLVPSRDEAGNIAWRIFPRGVVDIQLGLKQVDLALTMSSDLPVATRNDTINFTVVAENVGGLPATSVQVVDSLPLGLALLRASPSRGSYQASTGTWTIGDMPAGASDTLRLRTRVTTNLLGNLTNVARYLPLTTEQDVNPGNDGAAVTVVVVDDKVADIGIDTDVDRTEVLRGDTVEITVLAVNGGPQKATAVRIADTIPDGLSLLDVTATAGTYSEATGIWALDSIPVASTHTLIMSAEVTADSAVTLVNRAINLNLQRETDPDPTNDTASVTIDVITLRAADIEITTLSDKTDVVPGDTVDLRVIARNRGPFNAPRVTVSDTVQVGLALLSVSATTGFYDVTTALWTIDSLNALAADTLSLIAEVTAGPPDTLVNRAWSLGPDRPATDTANANDVDSVTIAVVDETRANMSVGVAVEPSLTIPGNTAVFTVTATNNGPLRATEVVVSDTVPSGVTLLSSAATAGAYDPDTGEWSLAAVESGATDTLRLKVRADSLGTHVNQARVTALPNEVDPDPDNDSASAALQVVDPRGTDLTVSLQLVDSAAVAGDTVGVRVVVRNAGNFNASGVAVLDSVISGGVIVSGEATRGSFDAETGRWAADTVFALKADTLDVRIAVTGSAGDSLVVRSQVLPPALPVVDLNPNNDTATLRLPVAAPAGASGAAARVPARPARPRDDAALPVPSARQLWRRRNGWRR